MENIFLRTRENMIWACALFFSAMLYSYSMLAAAKSWNSPITIAFILVLLTGFVYNTRRVTLSEDVKLEKYFWVVIAFTLALHCGIFAGFSFSGHGPQALWPKDAYDTHLWHANNIAAVLSGTAKLLTPYDEMDKLYLTHIWVGLFFRLFGSSPVVSGLALMFLKFGTVFFVFRGAEELFDRKCGAVAALLYAFMPTILFYTINFYKEAMVQLLVAAACYAAARLARRKFQPGPLLIGGAALAALINERFYVFAFAAASLIPAAFALRAGGKKKHLIAAAVLALSGAAFLVWRNFGVGLSALFSGAWVHKIGVVLERIRVGYAQYPDVAPLNASLPYPAAVLKISFTPFFTLNKFALFDDYSYLLIWGSFLSQAVILAAFLGMWRSIRGEKYHLFLVIPYFVFILVFAYFAPYNGRLRDSFYPLICIYAAVILSRIFSERLSRRG